MRYAILLLGGMVMAMSAQAAERIALDGEWGFRIDRDDAGVKAEWFNAPAEQRIRLPGTMTLAGYGDEVTVNTRWTGQIVDQSWFTDPRYEKYRQPPAKVPFWLTPVKHYVGPAWYSRTVEIPGDWKGRRIILSLERPHWETSVWVDGRPLGSRNSLATAHEYDLSHLAPGEHRLAIRVDNRMIVDVGINAHSVSDHTQTNWNGIVGRIELRAGSPVWIEDVQVYPDVAGRKARVHVTVGNATGRPVEGTITLAASSDNTARKHAVAPVKAPFRAGVTASPSVRSGTPSATELDIDLPMGADALLWAEFDPAVYRLTATLAAGDLSDARTTSFGLRQFTATGTQFSLNGQPIFIRGTLECCIFPLTGHPPMDVDSWMRILRIARAHGLNSLRFHSWCPPEAAFEAADRMGFMYQVEGGCWATVGENPKTDQWIRDECARIFRTYGNHPSFCLFTHGNEPGGGKQKQFLGELIAGWRKADARRLYTSGSGWPIIPENDYHCTPTPRIQAWGEGLRSRINARPPETVTDYRDFIGKQKVPVVSHEIGQWCVYPNLEEIAKYTGATRAANFEIFRDTLAARGMLDQAKDFLIASGKLQTLCYKEDIESALRTPGMAGFQLLDLHDFPGQGTALVGVLDPFWDSKGYVTAEEYHRFACETVPLSRLPKRILTSDETFTARVEIAHFGAAALKQARPAWEITTASGKRLAGAQWPARDIPLGNCIALGDISFPLADAPAPTKLILRVWLEGTQYSNDWDFWVYPAKAPPADAGDILVATTFNDEATAALAAGRKVLLMPAAGTVKGDERGRVAIGFSSIFWNTAWTRRQAPHTLGILCDPKHPALADFPTEFHSNWQWWELVTRSQAMILNDLPAFRPIVQVIDDWHTNRRLGLVFEAKVGSGRLLVCSVDLKNGLPNRPVARQFLASLLKYMNSDAFKPATTLEAQQVASLFTAASSLQAIGAKIEADSAADGYEPVNAIDGDPGTTWHTPWEGAAPDYPHELRIDLGRSMDLAGFRYLPRQDVQNGWASQYELYVSDKPGEWGKPAAAGRFPQNRTQKEVRFASPVKGRYVRFVALKGFGADRFATLAELELIWK